MDDNAALSTMALINSPAQFSNCRRAGGPDRTPLPPREIHRAGSCAANAPVLITLS